LFIIISIGGDAQKRIKVVFRK